MRAVVFGVAVAVLLAPAGARAQSPILKEIEAAFVRLHEEVGPSVVNIDTSGPVEDSPQAPDLFHFFGIPNPDGGQGPQNPQAPQIGRPFIRPHATGSGFIFSKDGFIITNNHVIENAESIEVKLWNRNEYKAAVVGQDPETDIAVIKIEPKEELIPARLGDSEALKVGQFAIAIGSPRGFEGSVSFGHISALGREGLGGLQDQGLKFQNLIQTDAAINLGNSGGPLCNINGEVIGINTAILWGANSIGFAIPISTAQKVVPQLISSGKVVRGFLGVGITDAREVAAALELPDGDGAFVERVESDSPAAAADIRTYDVIRSVNGETVRGATDLVSRISSLTPGAKVQLEIWRNQETLNKEVTLGERPAPTQQAQIETPDVFGMTLADLSGDLGQRLGLEEGTQGVLITNVTPGTPAEEAGLAQGDVITELAQKPVRSVQEFRELLEQVGTPGKALLVRYYREGSSRFAVLEVPAE